MEDEIAKRMEERVRWCAVNVAQAIICVAAFEWRRAVEHIKIARGHAWHYQQYEKLLNPDNGEE